MKIDVIGSNSLLFANLPPASQVPGCTYRVSDVGPAPGILLTSDGTKYRPAGGRQVLAMRTNNPVTVQSLTSVVAETIGTFPGGLLRSGMGLNMNMSVQHDGIGTGQRLIYFMVNNQFVGQLNVTTSGTSISSQMRSIAAIRNDTSGPHYCSRGVGPSYGVQSSAMLSFDVSAPLTCDIRLASVAENAVNISSATWSGGIATFNTAAAHTLAVGDKTVIASVTPTGWNIPAGAIVLTVPTTTQFTVAMAADPGAYTSGGTSSRISNMISQSYVLELVG